MMQIYLFLVGMLCSGNALINKVDSNTDTFRFNNMILSIEKSGAFEKEIGYWLSRPGYTEMREGNRFQIEFFTSKSNLTIARISPSKIKVIYNSKDKSTKDTYLEISVKNHAIRNFKIFDFFMLKTGRLSSRLYITT